MAGGTLGGGQGRRRLAAPIEFSDGRWKPSPQTKSMRRGQPSQERADATAIVARTRSRKVVHVAAFCPRNRNDKSNVRRNRCHPKNKRATTSIAAPRMIQRNSVCCRDSCRTIVDIDRSVVCSFVVHGKRTQIHSWASWSEKKQPSDKEHRCPKSDQKNEPKQQNLLQRFMIERLGRRCSLLCECLLDGISALASTVK